MIEDTIVFQKSGLNSDDDVKLLQNGDSQNQFGEFNRLNCVIEDGNRGTITNSKGNQLKSFTFTPGGQYKVIGTCYDRERNALIYFVWNGAGNHAIMRYHANNETFEKILFDESALNFQENFKIINPRIVGDSDEQMLFWTDGYFASFGDYNPPRKINIKKAIEYTAGTGGYSALHDGNFNVIKPQPSVEPKIMINIIASTDPGSSKVQYETEVPHDLTAGDYIIFYSTVDIAGVPIGEYQVDSVVDSTNFIVNIAYNLGFHPDFVYVSRDTSIKTNNIKGIVFQFSYRYIYDDNEISAWSNYSLGSIYLNEIFPDGYSSGDVQRNNIIKMFLKKDYDNAYFIELAVRNLDVGSGATGNWELYDRIDIQSLSTGTFSYSFLNDKTRKGLDNSDFDRNSDDVPFTSGQMEVINENRLALADNRLNYEFDALDVSLAKFNGDVLVDSNLIPWNEEKDSIAPLGTGNVDLSEAASALESLVKIVITDSTGGIEKYILPSNINYSTEGDITDFFVTKINVETELDITASKDGGNDNLIITSTLGAYFIKALIYPLEYFRTIKSLKRRATHYFGIKYYDNAGRSSRVLTSEDTSIYIEGEFESVAGLLDNNCQLTKGINFTINHTPPTWATHYQWCYGGNNIADYFQFLMYTRPSESGSGAFIDDVDTPDFIIDDYRNIKINFTKIKDRINNQSNGNHLESFEPEKGDKIRFMGFPLRGSGENSNGKVTTFGGATYAEETEFTILDYDNEYITIQSWDYLQSEGYLNGTEDYFGFGFFFGEIYAEIYRNKDITNAVELIYEEIGQKIEIGDAGLSTRYHKKGYSIINTSPTDQNGATPATGRLLFGDSYMYWRKMNDFMEDGYYSEILLPIESTSSSFVYNSKSDGAGRIDYVDPNQKFQRTNNIKWGGIYADGTNINDLSKFEPFDVVKLDDKWGRIKAIRESGYVLGAIQEKKFTSIDIGRTTQTQPDGSSTYLATNAVLGNTRPFEENFGTTHPESVISDKRHIYFFDVKEGAYVRYAPNGLFPVSGYKMKEWFRNNSENMITTGVSNWDVYSGFDEKNQMIYVTFRNAPDESGSGSESDVQVDANSYTIGFSETNNRWFSFYSFIPEMYGRIGGGYFTSFRDGQLYLHNQDVNRCTFYGEKFKQIIKITSNKNPNIVKVFDAIGVKPMKASTWEAPVSGDIEVEVYGMYPNNMISRLKSAIFDVEEGEGWSEFLRDMRSTSGTANVTDLYNGRELRGYSLSIKLENSDNDEVNLFVVQINSTRSYAYSK